MSIFHQNVIQEIKELLKPTAHHNSPIDLLHADIQHIKGNIKSVISNHINQLRLREQWLLQRVDSVHESYLQKLQADAEKLAEVKGKLQCCLEVVQDVDVKDSKGFNAYMESVIKASHTLMKHGAQYHSPSISFVGDDGDDGQLLREIQQYGKLSTPVTQGTDSGSDNSWCFAESVESSSPAEPVDCESCVGISFDVEDLSKNLCLIEKFIQAPVMSLNDVCLADDVCGSFAACVNDKACNGEHQVPSGNNAYVTAIDRACRSIASHGPPIKEEKGSADVMEVVEESTSYQPSQQVRSLQEEINRIVAGDVMPCCRPEDPRVPSMAPWSADVVAAEIAEIVQGSTTASRPAEEASRNVCNLMSEIDAIVSAESFQGHHSSTATEGTDAFMPGDLDLKPADGKTILEPSMKATAALSKILAECSIDNRSPVNLEHNQSKSIEGLEEDDYIVKGKDWCTVEDVHDILTAIVNS